MLTNTHRELCWLVMAEKTPRYYYSTRTNTLDRCSIARSILTASLLAHESDISRGLSRPGSWRITSAQALSHKSVDDQPARRKLCSPPKKLFRFPNVLHRVFLSFCAYLAPIRAEKSAQNCGKDFRNRPRFAEAQNGERNDFPIVSFAACSGIFANGQLW